MNQENFDSFVKILNRAGWSLSLRFDDEKVIGSLCHKDWITDNTSQSVPLPAFEADNIGGIFTKLILYFSL